MKKVHWLAALIGVALLSSTITYVIMIKVHGIGTPTISKEPVAFHTYAPDAKTVFVAGSFNAWQIECAT